MNLSVVVISFNTKALTKKCLESVLKNTSGIRLEIVVVDNASTDGSAKMLEKFSKKHKEVKLIKSNINLGFGGGNNLGFKKAKGDIVLFLNSDTLVESNTLGEMYKWMKGKKEIGIATCLLLNKDGSTQGTGGYFPTLTRVFTWMTIQDLPLVDRFIKPFHPMKEKSFLSNQNFYREGRELDWVTGAFFMIRRDLYEQVGGFDKDYFMYTEETDLCYRVKKLGWKVFYNPSWSIIHYGGESGGDTWYFVEREFEGVKTFYKKHMPKWQYPLLRVFLKAGALLRMLVYTFIGRKEAKIAYAKALRSA